VVEVEDSPGSSPTIPSGPVLAASTMMKATPSAAIRTMTVRRLLALTQPP
jgi:hypothetical protein